MAFYLNEFKQHLQALSDKVDHPYDEPARRHLNNKTQTGSLEEAYSAMKRPSMGSYQRPAPSMLNEQGIPAVPGMDTYDGFYQMLLYHYGQGTITWQNVLQAMREQFPINGGFRKWWEENIPAYPPKPNPDLPDPTLGGANTMGMGRAMGRGDSSQMSNTMPFKGFGM